MRTAAVSALLSDKTPRKRAVCVAAVFSALYLFFFCTGFFIYGAEVRYSDISGFAGQLCGYAVSVAVSAACQCAAVFAVYGLSRLTVPESISVFGLSCIYAFAVSMINYCVQAQSGVSLLMEYFFPSLAVFVLMLRLCLYGGIFPVLVYAALTGAETLLPFAPKSAGFAHICLKIVLPVMFIIALSCFDEKGEKNIGKHARKKEEKPKSKVRQAVFGSVIALGIALSIVFAAGILPFKPTTIATGSMTPELNVGDIVIVSTLDKDSIEVGDIIKFRRDGVNVVHRVNSVSTDENGEVTYITKGDANNSVDSGSVPQSDVEGKVVGTIPLIGKITLWINGVD